MRIFSRKQEEKIYRRPAPAPTRKPVAKNNYILVVLDSLPL
ncbi:MAG: hypothetical protein U5R06_13595 [candidate division KSB1 bacterium]|nr:hypothetical protein [candidate division KSB1 bacterium]